MAKVRVLTDVRIEVDPPSFRNWYRRSVEGRARELEAWAREFEAFVRDHRSQDPIYLNVIRDHEDQCSHCHSEWEMGADGPLCCEAALGEWNAEKNATEDAA